MVGVQKFMNVIVTGTKLIRIIFNVSRLVDYVSSGEMIKARGWKFSSYPQRPLLVQLTLITWVFNTIRNSKGSPTSPC
jgi:hypothetical protein